MIILLDKPWNSQIDNSKQQTDDGAILTRVNLQTLIEWIRWLSKNLAVNRNIKAREQQRQRVNNKIDLHVLFHTRESTTTLKTFLQPKCIASGNEISVSLSTEN